MRIPLLSLAMTLATACGPSHARLPGGDTASGESPGKADGRTNDAPSDGAPASDGRVADRGPRADSGPIVDAGPATFKGIFEFTGRAADATLPFLAGASLNYYWTDIEPAKGSFQWSAIDGDIATWAAAGKKVAIRITSSGNCMCTPSTCQRTPSWVFAEGLPSVADPAGATHPVFWNSVYLTEWAAFLQAVAARYDGNPAVAFFDAAIGNDGETIVDKETGWPACCDALCAWSKVGYTDTLWSSTIRVSLLTNIYLTTFSRTPLAVQIDKAYIGGASNSDILDFVSTHNLWFQNDSLYATQSLPAIWRTRPLVAEQGSPAASLCELTQDMNAALAEGARYILVFASDVETAAYQPELTSVAAMAH